MKFVTLCVIFVCCLSVFAQEAHNDELIWDRNRSLEWKDFNFVEDDSLCVFEKAYVSLKIKCVFFGNDTIYGNALAVFEKNKSITIDTLSLELLAHEQVHFDIAEIYARKMQVEFSNLSSQGLRKQAAFNLVFDSIYNEYLMFQNEYDRSTGHGVLDNKQAEWSKLVQNLLDLE